MIVGGSIRCSAADRSLMEMVEVVSVIIMVSMVVSDGLIW